MRQMEEETARRLAEKEQEMRLAVEERDLQKMATLSQQDSLRDHLQSQVETLQTVRKFSWATQAKSPSVKLSGNLFQMTILM